MNRSVIRGMISKSSPKLLDMGYRLVRQSYPSSVCVDEADWFLEADIEDFDAFTAEFTALFAHILRCVTDGLPVEPSLLAKHYMAMQMVLNVYTSTEIKILSQRMELACELEFWD